MKDGKGEWTDLQTKTKKKTCGKWTKDALVEKQKCKEGRGKGKGNGKGKGKGRRERPGSMKGSKL